MQKINLSIKWKLILWLCGLGVVLTFMIYLILILLGYSNISYSMRQSPVLNWHDKQVGFPVTQLLQDRKSINTSIENHLINLVLTPSHPVFLRDRLFTEISIQSFAVVDMNSQLIFKTVNNPLKEGDVGSQLPIYARDDLADALMGQLNSGVEVLSDNNYLVIKSIINTEESIVGATISWQSWKFNQTQAPMFYISYSKAVHLALVNTAASIFWVIPTAVIFGWLVDKTLQRRYKPLHKAIEDWSKGRLNSRIKYSGQDEISKSFAKLNQMAAKLYNHNEKMNHFTQRQARQQIALELHDTVKQQLFATNLQLSTALSAIETNSVMTKKHIEQAIAQNNITFDQINELITAFNPTAKVLNNLLDDLNQKLKEWQNQNDVQLNIDFTQFDPVLAAKLSHEKEVLIFRSVMEALQNTHKHADAKTIQIKIMMENSLIKWSVHNDGVNHNSPSILLGQGLHMIKSQIEALHGQMKIETKAGFTFLAQVPL